LTRFDPFQLLLVQGRSVAVVSTDVGGVTVTRGWLNAPVMVTSSALGDHLVNGPRMKLFEQLLTTSDSHLTAQSEFHRHYWPDRRDISVAMMRGDAATVSRTTITADTATIRLEYERMPAAEAIAC